MNEVTRKRMLYKSKVEYMSGEGVYTMNHIQGCHHGCRYPCYAFGLARRTGQVSDMDQWRDAAVVENTLSLLEAELAKLGKTEPVKRVHMCFTTDPFPYLDPERYPYSKLYDFHVMHDLTMDAINLLNGHGIPVSVLTKGLLPEYIVLDGDDGGIPCLRAAYGTSGHEVTWPHPENEFGISLVSLSEEFHDRWEPDTAPFADRLDRLKALHDAGFTTWVSMEPYPALKWNMGTDANCRLSVNDDHAGLKHLLSRVAWADKIVFGRWNYNKDAPCDVDDRTAWYSRAAEIVDGFCRDRSIRCVIKKGTSERRR